MATAKQIAANRLNALHSSGPRTSAGKLKVSQNRRSHGLLGRFMLYGAEDQQDYDRFLDKLIDEQKPVGLLETELVKKMSEHLWLCERARRHQEACFLQLGPVDPKTGRVETGILGDLERFVTYHARHDRAFHKSLNAFLRLRKEREMREIGFERQKRVQAEEIRRAAREKRLENEELRRQQSHKLLHATRELAFQLKQNQVLAATAAS